MLATTLGRYQMRIMSNNGISLRPRNPEKQADNTMAPSLPSCNSLNCLQNKVYSTEQSDQVHNFQNMEIKNVEEEFDIFCHSRQTPVPTSDFLKSSSPPRFQMKSSAAPLFLVSPQDRSPSYSLVTPNTRMGTQPIKKTH